MATEYAIRTIFDLKDLATPKLQKLSSMGGLVGLSLDRAARNGERHWANLKASVSGGVAFVGQKAAQITTLTGAALTVAAASATKKYIEFEDVVTKAGSKFVDLDVTSGTYAASLDALSKKAQEVGSLTKFSASDAAGALDKMAMAGLTSEQSMAMLMGTTNLATAAGLDLTSAVDMATDAMGIFNLMKDEAGNPLDASGVEKSMNRIADVVAKTTNMANLDMGMWFEAAKYGAPKLTSMGGTIEEFSAMAGILANSGIKGSMAGTGVNMMVARLTAPTGEAAKAIDRLGIHVFDAQGKMRTMTDILGQFESALSGLSDAEKAPMLKDIFGEQGGRAFEVLLKSGTGQMNEYLSMLKDAGGTAGNIARAQEKSLKGQLAALSSAFEGKQLQFGEAMSKAGGLRILEKFISFVQKLDLSPMISAFSAGFEKVSEIVLTTIEYLREYKGFGKNLSFKGLEDFFKNIDVISAARKLGNIIDAVSKIVSTLWNLRKVIAGLFIANKVFQGFEIGLYAFKNAKSFVGAFSDGLTIAQKSMQGLELSVDIARRNSSALGNVFGTVFTGIGKGASKAKSMLSAAGSSIVGAFSMAGSAIKTFFVSSVIPFVTNPITLTIMGIVAAVGLLAFGIYELIKHWDSWGQTVTGVLSVIFPPLGVLIGIIQSIYANWQNITAAFADGGIIAGIKAIGSAVLDGILGPFNAVRDAIDGFFSKINEMEGIGGNVLTVLVQPFERLWRFVSGIFDSIAAFRTGGIIAALKTLGLAILELIFTPIQSVLDLVSFIPGVDIGNKVRAWFNETRAGFLTPSPEVAAAVTTSPVTTRDSVLISEERREATANMNITLAEGLRGTVSGEAPGITVRQEHTGGFRRPEGHSR